MQKVSVIIPCYNREKTIKGSIVSVLNQSYPVSEVIVVDDCSTDLSVDRIKEISDSRVALIQLDSNKGAAAARNVGINMAGGGVIAFNDSDDLWHKNKLNEQIEELERNRADVICCSYIQDYFGKRRIVPSNGFDGIVNFEDLLEGNLIGTPCVIGRADCFKQVMFNEALRSLDDWEWAMSLSRQFKILMMRKPLVDVFIQENSMTLRWERVIPAMKIIYENHRDLIDAMPRYQAKWLKAVSNAKIACRMDPTAEMMKKLRIEWDVKTFVKLSLYKVHLLGLAQKMSSLFKDFIRIKRSNAWNS